MHRTKGWLRLALYISRGVIMKRKVTSLKTCIELINGAEEGLDLSTMRNAIDRQVRVILSLDIGDVYVCPLERTANEVIICDFCNDIDYTTTEQHPTMWDKGDQFVEIEHACERCLQDFNDLLKKITKEKQ